MRIDVWSDLVCPWCYLGKRRLEKALASFRHREAVEVRFHAFQLDPTLARGATLDVGEVLQAKYRRTAGQVVEMQRNLENLAAADGLEYHLVGGRTGNTFDAHRVVKLAAAKGLEGPVLERLFRAHFTERRSIFDAAGLAALAAEAGLDAGEVGRALETDAHASEVEADIQSAAELGIHGVPFFVLAGKYAVSGAQPAEVLGGALTTAWQAASAA